MTTLNEKRRALIQAGEDTSIMDSNQIEDTFNRNQLASVAEDAVIVQAESTTVTPNKVTGLDDIAATLLTGGMEVFKQSIETYIQANIPEPVEKIIQGSSSKTVTITLDSEGNQVIPEINPVSQGPKTVKDLFGVNGKYTFETADYTENKPDFYDMQHMHKSGVLQAISIAKNLGKHVWLYGEKATGKTTFVQHLAAKLGRNFVRIQHHKAMEPKDLVGSYQIPDGKSVWRDGALTQAIRIPNTDVLLDEPTVNPPACELYQSMLDEGYLTIEETGEKVYIAEGVQFFVCDNTNGHGDDTGRYNGTAPVNGALVDRFHISAKLTYMSRKQEASILKRFGLNDNQAKLVAEYAHMIRAQVKTGAIEEPISLRRLIAFTEQFVGGLPQDLALDLTIMNQVCHEQDREAYKQLANAHMPDLHNV